MRPMYKHRSLAVTSCCVAPGGFFDGKTDADARRLYLLNLLKQSAEQESSSCSQQTLSDQEVGHAPSRLLSKFLSRSRKTSKCRSSRSSLPAMTPVSCTCGLDGLAWGVLAPVGSQLAMLLRYLSCWTCLPGQPTASKRRA